MARIKIKDLPKDQKINKREMQTIIGGTAAGSPTTSPDLLLLLQQQQQTIQLLSNVSKELADTSLATQRKIG
jgi:hypothetical protein